MNTLEEKKRLLNRRSLYTESDVTAHARVLRAPYVLFLVNCSNHRVGQSSILYTATGSVTIGANSLRCSGEATAFLCPLSRTPPPVVRTHAPVLFFAYHLYDLDTYTESLNVSTYSKINLHRQHEIVQCPSENIHSTNRHMLTVAITRIMIHCGIRRIQSSCQVAAVLSFIEHRCARASVR